jgi:hypothetical protein
MFDRIPEIELETEFTRRYNQRPSKTQGRFLKGPIPMRHIEVAAKLSGKALAVFLAVHHRVALTGETSVSLPMSMLEGMGVNKDAKARALSALEAAGLITVERVPGHTARVQLRCTDAGAGSPVRACQGWRGMGRVSTGDQ